MHTLGAGGAPAQEVSRPACKNQLFGSSIFLLLFCFCFVLRRQGRTEGKQQGMSESVIHGMRTAVLSKVFNGQWQEAQVRGERSNGQEILGSGLRTNSHGFQVEGELCG